VAELKLFLTVRPYGRRAFRQPRGPARRTSHAEARQRLHSAGSRRPAADTLRARKRYSVDVRAPAPTDDRRRSRGGQMRAAGGWRVRRRRRLDPQRTPATLTVIWDAHASDASASISSIPRAASCRRTGSSASCVKSGAHESSRSSLPPPSSACRRPATRPDGLKVQEGLWAAPCITQLTACDTV
jgi:hypothetical protein